jgi:hypothetical protein
VPTRGRGDAQPGLCVLARPDAQIRF